MNYSNEELLEQLRLHVTGELTIPGKFYPDVSKWQNTAINTFGGSHTGRLSDGTIQYLADLNKMQEDESRHDWIGNYERKLKQDAFNAAHPQKPLPKKAPPKVSKRSWLTKRHPEVIYNTMQQHYLDSVGDTQTYSWASSKPSVATVVNKNSTTTTATGVAPGVTSIQATLNTVADDGTKGTSYGSTDLTVTAAPAEKPHAKTGSVSLSNSAATVGTAFTSNASISNLVDADDGSYSYAWSFSGNVGFSFGSSNKSTTTITGTPTAAGTVSVRCSIKDSYGNYATITAGSITVTSGSSKAHVTDGTVTGSAEGSWANSDKKGTYQHRLFHCVASADDGSFTYQWGWSGTAPSGWSYDTPTSKDSYITGTCNTAGTYNGLCTVTDSYGGKGTYTFTAQVS